MMWTTRELTDKTEIQAFLERDRLYAAYALGDLEPGLFEDCTWAGAERDGWLGALVLHYRGLDPPALFLMSGPSFGNERVPESGDEAAHDSGAAGGQGLRDGALRAILSDELCPKKVYMTCRPEHLDLAREFYDWLDVVPMWRMALAAGAFQPVAVRGCESLTADDAEELAAFYARGGAVAFGREQVGRGVYYGLRVEGRLAATAGTHLVSQIYGVAALGNVYTEPEHRGQGYGTRVTSAVVADLLVSGIGDIVLNVAQENLLARRIYERLGFERYCAFLEGPAERRSAHSR